LLIVKIFKEVQAAVPTTVEGHRISNSVVVVAMDQIATANHASEVEIFVDMHPKPLLLQRLEWLLMVPMRNNQESLESAEGAATTTTVARTSKATLGSMSLIRDHLVFAPADTLGPIPTAVRLPKAI
jgi:hypothetical protein